MSISIRDAYANALIKYGKDDERIVVLDADLSSSTKSGAFQKVCPERFFNVGIAEYNMVSMAAGFASAGKIAFANTFAVFITTIASCAARSLAGYSKLDVKLMGAYTGMSDAYDGPSHHAIEDMAMMRAIPNFKVLVACDEYQTDWLVKACIETPGPVYVRLLRGELPACYTPDTQFELGKGKVLREGSDVTIIACGTEVSQSLDAARILEGMGISARVVDMFTIKPIDRDLILESAQKTGTIVTAEEHSVIGGLGAAVADVLAREGCAPLTMVGIQDTFTTTGDYAKLLKHFGLDAASIAQKALEAISKKSK